MSTSKGVTTSVATIKQISTQLESYKTADVARQQLEKRLLQRVAELEKELEETKSDLEDQERLRREWKTKAESARLARSRKQFVLLLVDGNSFTFNAYFKSPNGGNAAIRDVILQVRRHIDMINIPDMAIDYKVMVHVYAGKKLLSKALQDAGFISAESDLANFVGGFTRSPFVQFKDCGEDASQIDIQIRETHKQWIDNVHCRRVILAVPPNSKLVGELIDDWPSEDGAPNKMSLMKPISPSRGASDRTYVLCPLDAFDSIPLIAMSSGESRPASPSQSPSLHRDLSYLMPAESGTEAEGNVLRHNEVRSKSWADEVAQPSAGPEVEGEELEEYELKHNELEDDGNVTTKEEPSWMDDEPLEEDQGVTQAEVEDENKVVDTTVQGDNEVNNEVENEPDIEPGVDQDVSIRDHDSKRTNSSSQSRKQSSSDQSSSLAGAISGSKPESTSSQGPWQQPWNSKSAYEAQPWAKPQEKSSGKQLTNGYENPGPVSSAQHDWEIAPYEPPPVVDDSPWGFEPLSEEATEPQNFNSGWPQPWQNDAPRAPRSSSRSHSHNVTNITSGISRSSWAKAPKNGKRDYGTSRSTYSATSSRGSSRSRAAAPPHTLTEPVSSEFLDSLIRRTGGDIDFATFSCTPGSSSAVPINRNKQRIDLDLPRPTREQLAAFAARTSGLKLCEQHFLRDYCPFNPCEFDHDPIDPDMVGTLRWHARRTPCHDGVMCRDPLCFFGHRCPFGTGEIVKGNEVLCNNPNCAFKKIDKFMHGSFTKKVDRVQMI